MERPRNPEEIRPGQLYFLSHPGSELFSGCGLTTQAGRNDHLVGLLMVDRPHPVDPAWLAEIEVRYGDYQLVPMTATGERGIFTQMRIAPASLAFLDRFTHPVAHEFARVLQPFLDSPPAPILKVQWNEEQELWTSSFWQGLPPEMQAVFEQLGEGCLAAERADNTVAFVTHAADADIERFHDAPVNCPQRQLELRAALPHGKCNLAESIASRIMSPIVGEPTERRGQREVIHEFSRQTGVDSHAERPENEPAQRWWSDWIAFQVEPSIESDAEWLRMGA